MPFTSRQEAADWRKRRDGVRKRFNLDWGYKVYVYRPDGTPIIGARSKGDDGYRYPPFSSPRTGRRACPTLRKRQRPLARAPSSGGAGGMEFQTAFVQQVS